MADKTAQQYIGMWETEFSKPENCNFRNLWQETSNYIYPLENQITNLQTPGQKKTDTIYDVTGKMESQNMASDLSSLIIPPGQRFFEVEMSDEELNRIDNVRKYLGNITDLTHNEIFRSNFILQFNECTRSLVTFGTGNIYSEFGLLNKNGTASGVDTALNFCDYPIGTYIIIENNKGLVDTIFVKFSYTASQAVREWGEDALGEKVKKAYNEPKNANDVFYFLHIVQPRTNRDPNSNSQSNLPYESVYISIEDSKIIDEGGFEEFPFHCPRWMKSSSERWGRGQGTEILPVVKMLQKMHEQMIDSGNIANNPPREVLDTFEGTLRTTPGAVNFVQQMNSTRSMHEFTGNFPVTKDILEFEQNIVKDAFFSNVLNQLINLEGDRRTTLEISERVKAGLKRLSLPVARLYGELFNTLIPRCIKILMRNGVIPPPPPELQGKDFNIKYVGPLALALRNQQAQAYKEWLSFVAQTSTFAPDALDIVNLDRGNIELARSYGVKESVIATEDEIAAKREQRAAQQQAMIENEMLKTATAGYKNIKEKPEDGSPAKMLMEAAVG